jgi:hypothetical protein
MDIANGASMIAEDTKLQWKSLQSELPGGTSDAAVQIPEPEAEEIVLQPAYPPDYFLG